MVMGILSRVKKALIFGGYCGGYSISKEKESPAERLLSVLKCDDSTRIL